VQRGAERQRQGITCQSVDFEFSGVGRLLRWSGVSACTGQTPAPQPLSQLSFRSQKHVDQGQFPEFMPKDTIMQQSDWWVLLPAACA
jgi:hypothetical protein